MDLLIESCLRCSPSSTPSSPLRQADRRLARSQNGSCHVLQLRTRSGSDFSVFIHIQATDPCSTAPVHRDSKWEPADRSLGICMMHEHQLHPAFGYSFTLWYSVVSLRDLTADWAAKEGPTESCQGNATSSHSPFDPHAKDDFTPVPHGPRSRAPFRARLRRCHPPPHSVCRLSS